jgi:hypothetical protein
VVTFRTAPWQRVILALTGGTLLYIVRVMFLG